VEEKAAATGEASTQLVAYCGTRDPVCLSFCDDGKVAVRQEPPKQKKYIT